jgi:hypothetical protein
MRDPLTAVGANGWLGGAWTARLFIFLARLKNYLIAVRNTHPTRILVKYESDDEYRKKDKKSDRE